MPRPKKSLEEQVAEFDCCQIKKKRYRNQAGETAERTVIVCDFCCIEISQHSNVRARLCEHVNSKQHKTMKENHEKGQQISISLSLINNQECKGCSRYS